MLRCALRAMILSLLRTMNSERTQAPEISHRLHEMRKTVDRIHRFIPAGNDNQVVFGSLQ